LLPWILLSDFIPLRKEVMLIWFSLSFFPPLFFFFWWCWGSNPEPHTC
jgi:hypothetical protein